MKTEEYLNGVRFGVERLNEALDPKNSGIDTAACVAHIEAGTGDPYNCRGTLHTYATIKALLAWFEESDLSALKQWAFVAGKLRRAMYQMRPHGVYYTPVYLLPLLSDHQSLIDWFSRFEYPFTLESGSPASTRLNNPRMDEYYHYNTWLALRGDWKLLAERCRAFLGDVPAKQAAYQADSRFHLALTEGDVGGMESALAELVEPKLMRRRQREEGGYSQHLICTFAIVYAKIAWRHGFQVNVDSPFVPKEWLPIAPLPKYEDVFAFMAKSDDSIPVART
jgi:hypothetical protein